MQDFLNHCVLDILEESYTSRVTSRTVATGAVTTANLLWVSRISKLISLFKCLNSLQPSIIENSFRVVSISGIHGEQDVYHLLQYLFRFSNVKPPPHHIASLENKPPVVSDRSVRMIIGVRYLLPSVLPSYAAVDGAGLLVEKFNLHLKTRPFWARL